MKIDFAQNISIFGLGTKTEFSKQEVNILIEKYKDLPNQIPPTKNFSLLCLILAIDKIKNDAIEKPEYLKSVDVLTHKKPNEKIWECAFAKEKINHDKHGYVDLYYLIENDDLIISRIEIKIGKNN